MNHFFKDNVGFVLVETGCGRKEAFRWRNSQSSEVWDRGPSSETGDIVSVHPMFKQEWTLRDRDLLYLQPLQLAGLFGATFLLLGRHHRCSPLSQVHRALPGALGSHTSVSLGPCRPRAQSPASPSTSPQNHSVNILFTVST